MKYLKNKAVLVTGACGSIGRELVRRLLVEKDDPPSLIVGIDNNENGIFLLEQHYFDCERAKFFVSDICDPDSLMQRMEGIDVCFHTAALKHVPLCERSPIDTNRTNVYGVRNIVELATQAGVERVIFTSSDKAVNPVSVMGASKFAGECMMIEAAKHTKSTIFASMRFGNVLGSSGSVVPLFHRQIAAGGPITLTAPDMRRFVMSVQTAVDLILESGGVARGGEVFVAKMPVLQMQDLCEVMIRELAPAYEQRGENIDIQLIGARPGEKLHEELMREDEVARTFELDRYFVILPTYSNRNDYSNHLSSHGATFSTHLERPYITSERPVLDKFALARFLGDNGLLDPLPEYTKRS